MRKLIRANETRKLIYYRSHNDSHMHDAQTTRNFHILEPVSINKLLRKERSILDH